MKKRWICFLLVLSMIMTLASVSSFAEGYKDPVTENGATIENPNTSFSNRRDLVLDKTLSANQDGTFDLKLETYATGKVTTSVKTTQIPTDFVCVVDQSGSMAFSDMPTDYEPVDTPAGGWKLSDFDGGKDTDGNSADKEYYFYDQNTGDYYRVYRKWGDVFERVPRNTVYCKDIVDSRHLTWFADEQGTEQDFNSQYYYQPASDINITRKCAGNDYIQPGGENDYNFYPLTISSQGRTFYYSIRLNYYDSTNTKRYLRFTNNNANTTANKDLDTGSCIWYKNPSGNYFGPGDRYLLIVSYNAGIGIDANDFVINWINGNANWDSFYTYGQITSGFQSGMFIQNTMFIRHVNYNALAYRDANGVEHIIDSTDYCDKQGTPKRDAKGEQDFTMNVPLYKATGVKETRLEAMKNALTAFVENVAGQTDDNGPVDHRVAIVGFSSNETTYNNTEIMTNEGFAASNNNGIAKRNASDSTYEKALISARANDQGAVNSGLTAAIANLTANGGTQPEDGLDMAYSILNNSIYKDEYAAKTRNAVVIFFTDGRPGQNSESNQYTEANEVVASAWNIKRDFTTAQIYSVGVFGEADGNPLTYFEDLTNWWGASTTRVFLEKQRLEEDRIAAGAGNDSVSPNPSNYRDYQEYAEEIYYPDFYKEEGTIDPTKFTYKWDYSWGSYRRSADVTGYVHTISGTFWREAIRNAEGYPAQQNDTIADYMTVVSSTYPNATSFDGNWLSNTKRVYNTVVNGARGAAGNKMYYSLCTDSQRLTEVFVNIAENVDTAGSTIELDDSAQLRDIVNTDVFKMPANTGDVTAYAVSASARNENGNIIYTFGTDHEQDFTPIVNPDGTVSVSGFDYSTHYVMEKPPAGIEGQKLILEINGLELKQVGDNLLSNGDAGIYATKEEDGQTVISDEPTLNIDSPKLNTGNAYFAVQRVKVNKSDRTLSEDGEKSVYLASEYADGDFNIVDKVNSSDKEKLLYGGVYGGYNNGMLSDALTLGNETGLSFTPSGGRTYYLKEVPANDYLKTKILWRSSGPNIVSSYLITTLDSEHDYRLTGFVVDGSNQVVSSDGKDIYKYFILANGPIAGSNNDKTKVSVYVSDLSNDSDAVTEAINNALKKVPVDKNGTTEDYSQRGNVTIKQAFKGTNGYMSKYPIDIKPDEIKGKAFWVTHDGVMVTGINERTVVNGKATADTEINDNPIDYPGTITNYEDHLNLNTMFVGADDVDEEEPADPGVKLAGYTTSLNGNIAMNFYMDLSDEVAADKDAYMQFTLPGANHTEEVVKLADAKKQVRGGKTYYVFSAGVAAKDMTSEIKAQFVKGDGIKSEEWSYTIKEYCDYVRNHPDSYDAESVALVEAMLNYGGYTQEYFKHNTDKLANADLDLALPEANLDETFDPVVSGECTGLSYQGTSSMLTTTTGLKYYFDIQGDVEDYTFEANGKELQLQSDKNGTYVHVDNIKAKDLNKPIAVTVTNKDGSTYTLKYSVYTNVKQVVESESFPTAAKNMMKALYGYGEAAIAYFATRA